MRHAVELTAFLDKTFGTKDRSEWREILSAGGIVFDVVASAQDIPNDSQIMANEILVPFDNDTVLTVASPISIEGQDKVSPRRPPTVGQHTDEVLHEAGYDAAMIATLRADGAVA
jgi:formyl-CoA transferase